MSIVLPSLPTAKSSGFVPAQSDNTTLTQDWLAQLLAPALRDGVAAVALIS